MGCPRAAWNRRIVGVVQVSSRWIGDWLQAKAKFVAHQKQRSKRAAL
jgi:hypothetical protein